MDATPFMVACTQHATEMGSSMTMVIRGFGQDEARGRSRQYTREGGAVPYRGISIC
jgi:hypothetical protein